MCQILLIILLTFSPFCKTESHDGFLSPPKYENYTEMKALLLNLEKKFPELVKILVIGQSVMQRDLLVIEINRNVQSVAQLTPKFKYVGNIYGDETVGKELLIYLAQYLLYNYGKLPRTTRLVDTVDIFIIPTMNPDGFENADVGECDDSDGKYNEEEVDLNTNFPNMVTGKPDFNLIQPETQAMMDFMSEYHFVLSGSLQGGSLRYTYPHEKGGANHTENTISDDDIFKELGHLYANRYPGTMGYGVCGRDDSLQPVGGKLGADGLPQKRKISVRNYPESTGMHNYNYFGTGCIELIFFVSCCNYPRPVELEFEWSKHKASLLAYMEGVHWGVKGVVMNDMGQPIINATISIEGRRKSVKTNIMGEYWRLLLPGHYKMFVDANGYKKTSATITVVRHQTTFKSFFLSKPIRNIGEDDDTDAALKKQLMKVTKNGLGRIHLPVYLSGVPSITIIFVARWCP